MSLRNLGRDLTPAQVLVLRALRLAAVEGAPCPSNQVLMRVVGTERSATITAILARLESIGLIRVARTAGAHGARTVIDVATGKATAPSPTGRPSTGLRRRARPASPGTETPVPRRKRVVGRVTPAAVRPVPATGPVDRDPCPRCGVRRDIGCAHAARALSVAAY